MTLQLCKSMDIHKGQGMKVGEGKQFNACACVAYLLTDNDRNFLGLELMAGSKAQTEGTFALDN